MKKGILLFLSMMLCFGLAACAEREATPPATEQHSQQEQTENEAENQATEEPSSDITPQTPETVERKAKLTIDGQEFDVTLYDTPAADALYNMLPLTLTFEDFNNTEKIAYMDAVSYTHLDVYKRQVVHREGVPHEVRENRRRSRPRLDDALLVLVVHINDLFHQGFLDVRSFLNASSHISSAPPLIWRFCA